MSKRLHDLLERHEHNFWFQILFGCTVGSIYCILLLAFKWVVG